MSLPNGFFQLLVRCPRCDGRNAVDVRRQGLASRARCGRCGEPLPRRLPAPLLLVSVTVLVVVLGLAHFAVSAVRERSAARGRERIAHLLDEGRAAEASGLLVAPRTKSSEDGLLARRVAEALAAPVLAVDRDAASGPTAVAAAVAKGDELIDEYDESLPELLAVLDEPLRRLQARSTAFRILEVADEHASQDKPDMAKVDRALQDASVAALSSPPDVAAAVEAMTHAIRARATLSRARALAQARPEEARRLLVATAQRLPAPPGASLATAASAHRGDDAPHGELLDLLARVRAAVSARDADALVALVRARPEPDWPADARAQLDAEVRRACIALASLEADRASREWDPAVRARRLLTATTCDEVLPADFLAAARVALAETLVEGARRGGSLEDALLAWDGVESPRRDANLATLACLAEARGARALAVLAWSRVASAQALARITSCAERVEDPLPPPTLPMLDYPAPSP